MPAHADATLRATGISHGSIQGGLRKNCCGSRKPPTWRTPGHEAADMNSEACAKLGKEAQASRLIAEGAHNFQDMKEELRAWGAWGAEKHCC